MQLINLIWDEQLTHLPGQNGHHFADDIVKRIFMNETFCILIRISLKFVPKVRIDNKSALVQLMVWRLKQYWSSSLTHICGTSGRWVNTLRPRQNGSPFSRRHFKIAFSWMKIYELHLRFHWSLFLGVWLRIFQHWFKLWLGTVQATSHYLNQWWLVYWRIYASLGLNELMPHPMWSI